MACLIIGYFIFDLGQFLNLAYLKQQHGLLVDYKTAFPLKAALVFFMAYVVVTGISLPGAGVLTIAGGAVFGILWGTIISSFASAIGATIALIITRYLFRDVVQRRFAVRLAVINKGIELDGAFYLFLLRLTPVPFFIINLLMALTPIRVASFYLTTQIGMLAGLIVLVNAGSQIAKINTVADIFSPGVLLSLVLLGVFPLIAKKTAIALRSWRTHQDNYTGSS